MGYNLPLVVSSAITDSLILNYKSGLSLFEVGDVEELAEVLNSLCNKSRLEEGLGGDFFDESWYNLLRFLTNKTNQISK